MKFIYYNNRLSCLLQACGPTLQRVCGENVYVNGQCYQLDLGRPEPRRTLPAVLPGNPCTIL